jgi:ATP-dependent RNA helicase DeaD
VHAFAVFGGEDASLQFSKLKHGVHVLVATPGRLIDFIYGRHLDLSHVETLILDEADEMLSMGFYEDLEFIIQCLIHEHQTLLFSATMPKEIRLIAQKHMKDPKEISFGIAQGSPKTLDHKFCYCRHHDRESTLLKLIKEEQPRQAMIFCRSRDECERVCQTLQRHLHHVDFLHAGLGQDMRTMITNKFRSEKIKFLVATDVASRGLDFSKVSHVFIYHLGDDPDLYIHRSGRTGRFDKAGIVITLVTDRELRTLSKVLEVIKREPIWIGEAPNPKRHHSPRPRPQGPRRHPK